ncbi:hypothetical protein OEZ85_012586 [Tetradesmus obliquus]|uniref:DUF2415 domain-containing protein n=1 Tax=Tetradesmus obliquus TaxID=3088 RepID=A0ABY8U5V4_TETOB|nr:hypothetical protein OEZ85_012586 [Tetradesmus obliquus]
MSAYTDCLEEATFTQGDPVVYQRPTSIHHWQLRDLISAADNEQEFYCVHDTCVYSFNTDTKQSKLVTNLGWSANSMTCRAGFLAAGGLHGELEVRQLSTGEACFKGSVGSTVNNALHIAQHSSGEVRLFVCCNDNSIKVYALPSMDAVTVIRCPCPINYAALSPDGQHLVAVGDCNPTLLYQATPTGYAASTSFTEASDVGMCCAWSHHGTSLAACAQDGTVAVWDARSGACASRCLLPSAARCVKWAAPPLDLLAVAEHEARISLLDARRWGSGQALALGGAVRGAVRGGAGLRSLDVSGIAFSPSGRRLWVGLEPCCVGFSIDSLKRRTFGVADML